MASTRRGFLKRSAVGAAALGAGGLLSALPDAIAASRLSAGQLHALRAAVRGPVLSPGGRGYDSARVLYNRRFDARHPPAIVRARDVADVRAAVGWARRYDVPLVVRSGGHAYNGASTSDAAVVVDVGALHAIAVHTDGVSVSLGPGARNIDVYAALAQRGIAIPSGSCPMVAVGGLATGGGMGLAGRELGLMLDRVTSFDVVTADGRLVTADANHHPDLFWALRGGGGSFGIVTRVRLRARRVAGAAWFFASFPREQAGAVLAAWDALAPVAPDALTSILTLPAGGGRVTALGQFFGPAQELRRQVGSLAAIPGARMSTGTSPYLTLQRRWAGCADGGLATCHSDARTLFAASSLYVARPLSASGRQAFIDAADGATLVLDAYGGAIGRVAGEATAFAHRDVRFSAQILSYAPLTTARARVAQARRLLAPYGNGQAYQNYADPSLIGALRAYYGPNLARLIQVKRAVDPEDRFRPAQGIRAG